ncbi:MAG: uroporphyrinogen decarboxylase family protein [Phycisphaerae bacterium]
MKPIERVQCVLDGRRPDHPPVSFWHHFAPDQVHGPAAVAAHVAHVETFDLDFLKVMNDNPYPHATPVESIGDLASLTVMRGDEPEFARQLDLLADLKRSLRGPVLMTTTIFNAWATLRRLVRPPTRHGPPNLEADDEASRIIKVWYAEDPAAVTTAIRTIASSLGSFARRCVDAGADGIFLSVRDDWVDSPADTTRLYDKLVRPTDLEILAGAAAGRLNMLHVCGKAVDLRAFAEYPVHALNWADRAAGPAIAAVSGWARPAICGGIDNLTTLPNRTAAECENEVIEALKQAGDRPIMIAPGCTYDPERVPRENLQAVCHAARR